MWNSSIANCSLFPHCFSLTWPFGPGQSSSCNVHVCMYEFIYIYVPSQRNLFQGLSLALRSHDQFKVSHWSTLLPYSIPSPPFFNPFFFYTEEKIKYDPFGKFLSVLVSVLLSATAKRVSVTRMQDILIFF